MSLADYSVCGRPTGGDGAASGIANRSLGVDTGIPLTEEYRQTVPNSTGICLYVSWLGLVVCPVLVQYVSTSIACTLDSVALCYVGE